MKLRLVDSISPNIKFSLEESAEVDGVHILAKVKGEFFVPNGVSRNKRYYPQELWQKIIESPTVKQKLEDKIMFGTIGHDGELGDKGVRDGHVSHFMTSIDIENGKGMGECFILNTPTGKILNTMLRAGSKLRVSSRANGTFKGTHEGLPVVDMDNYDLEGWDFVIEAGFLQANPSVAEAYNDLQKTINNETLLKTEKRNGDVMTEKTLDATLVQHIVDENSDLKRTVAKITEELDAVKADKEASEKEIEDLKADDQEVAEKLKKLKKYEEIGEPEELEAEKAKAVEVEAENDEFKELGDSPEEVKESLLAAKNHLTYIKENFGTIKQIKSALIEAVNFKKEINAIGTVASIKESMISLKKIKEEAEIADAEAEAKSLADELGLSVEEVKELLATNSAEEIKSMYNKVAEAFTRKNGNSRFEKKAPSVILEGKKIEEDETFSSKSRADRMNERLSK